MRKILYIILISTLCLMFPLSKSYAQQGWYSQQSGAGNTQLLSTCFPDTNIGYVVGGSGTIIKTTNSGINWVNQTSPVNKYLYSVCFVNVNTGYIVGDGGVIIKTINGGVSWSSQTLGTTKCFSSAYFTDASNGYIVGGVWAGPNVGPGPILKTINGGANWIPLSSYRLNSVYFTDINTGYAVGYNGNVGNSAGIIIKTANGGSSWNSQTLLANGYLRSVYFPNANTGFVIGVYWNTNTSVIFKTSNSGTNWVALASAVSPILTSIYFANVNTGYVAGVNGTIRKTTNGGNNWFSQSSGTNNVLHSVFFVNNLTGWAVGDNGTILKTTTGGILLPSAPVLYSPPNGSIGISLTPFLDWNDVYTATTYGVQVSTEPSFAAPLIDVSNLSASQYIVPNGLLTNNTIYYWRANASNGAGIGPWSNIWYFTTLITGVQKYSVKIPGEFDLYQNYPNPFNPATSIKFDISKSSFVNIKIYDMLGRQVTELVNQKLEPGSYQVEWNASNCPSGMYLYSIVAEANNERFEKNIKMILLK